MHLSFSKIQDKLHSQDIFITSVYTNSHRCIIYLKICSYTQGCEILVYINPDKYNLKLDSKYNKDYNVYSVKKISLSDNDNSESVDNVVKVADWYSRLLENLVQDDDLDMFDRSAPKYTMSVIYKNFIFCDKHKYRIRSSNDQESTSENVLDLDSAKSFYIIPCVRIGDMYKSIDTFLSECMIFKGRADAMTSASFDECTKNISKLHSTMQTTINQVDNYSQKLEIYKKMASRLQNMLNVIFVANKHLKSEIQRIRNMKANSGHENTVKLNIQLSNNADMVKHIKRLKSDITDVYNSVQTKISEIIANVSTISYNHGEFYNTITKEITM